MRYESVDVSQQQILLIQKFMNYVFNIQSISIYLFYRPIDELVTNQNT